MNGTVLVIRRIHVEYALKVDPAKREIAERVLGFHADSCPVARTLKGCVAISTGFDMIDV